MVALNTSLEKRGPTQEELLGGVEVISSARTAAEVARHNVSVTF
ncbi:MAG: hypothetical protein Q7R39_11255 [Dehalococcoidia bacterium]|nr:hypothetical protein [Dehalococcoidia bacterium]